MKHLLHRLLCSLAALTLAAGAQAATDAATAEALLRKSGTWVQLAEIGPQLRAGITAGIVASAPDLPAQERARLGQAGETAYTADRLRSITVSVVSQTLDQAHVAALRGWYDARLGQAITKMEEDGAALGGQDPGVIVQKGKQVLAEMSEERRRLTHELAPVSRAAEFMTDVTIGMTMAIQQGVRNALPNADGPAAAVLRAALDAQRPQLMQQFSELALASSALIYDQLPTADLATYIAFLKSAPGQHFADVGLRAMERALVLASEDFGRRVASPGVTS